MPSYSALVAAHDNLIKSLTNNPSDDLYLMLKYEIKCINAWKKAISNNQENVHDFQRLVQNILNEKKAYCENLRKPK